MYTLLYLNRTVYIHENFTRQRKYTGISKKDYFSSNSKDTTGTVGKRYKYNTVILFHITTDIVTVVKNPDQNTSLFRKIKSFVPMEEHS